MSRIKVAEIIDSLDSRHTDASAILHALAEGKKVKPADIDALDSKFIQVAPLLHKFNEGKAVTQADIDALDSFAGARLRAVLQGLAAGNKTAVTRKPKAKKSKARRKK